MSLAYIINFTGFSGHWGMYGTSLALALGLGERGYRCDHLGVDEISGLCDRMGESLRTPEVGPTTAVLEILPPSLVNADIVVVNAEGTLHGNRPSAHNLLRLVTWISRALGKPIYVINAAYFPAHGVHATDPASLDTYAAFTQALENDPRSRLVLRDRISLRNAAQGSEKARLGSDALPLLLEAMPMGAPTNRDSGPVIVSGGAGMSQRAARNMARSIERSLGPDAEIVYLSGGTPVFVEHDHTIFEGVAEVFPAAVFTPSPTFTAFRDTLAGGRLLVSGRFHYLRAAIHLGLPVAALSSNTPKNEELLASVGSPQALPRATRSARLTELRRPLNRPFVASWPARMTMIVGARRNFIEIPIGGPPTKSGLAERMANRLGGPLEPLRAITR